MGEKDIVPASSDSAFLQCAFYTPICIVTPSHSCLKLCAFEWLHPSSSWWVATFRRFYPPSPPPASHYGELGMAAVRWDGRPQGWGSLRSRAPAAHCIGGKLMAWALMAACWWGGVPAPNPTTGEATKKGTTQHSTAQHSTCLGIMVAPLSP